MKYLARLELLAVRLGEFALVALLAGMTVMVFGNVVLRYGFNSGWNFSEEMSRYFFVWLAFIGAILAFREYNHIGVETVVRMFGPVGRRVCLALTNLVILLCASVLFWGTWVQHPINASMTAPVVGLRMIWVYGITYVTGGCIALMALLRIVRAITGRTPPHEMARFTGEYEEVEQKEQR
ncbi:TRAP transporter small permease [Roseinatronobacter alkalisoli]|uniref:TRAP transporter small permease protein n=1 Tax=Roseinatronobacter alkalisoli TaxID=3028235 RepID=A0ABT5T4G2_9RHOB|nr:TRAP transporter small permease [Roseinatronobacter sp. HJB301]MDD7969939.1 TRAP transporter small permease [Roseinatronobacter sp. HJB301]